MPSCLDDYIDEEHICRVIDDIEQLQERVREISNYKIRIILLRFGKNTQVIVGITVKDVGTKKVIDGLDKASYTMVEIGKRAFVKMS